MVNIHVLCTEILLDAIGLVMGSIVLRHASDNKMQRAWGILSITLSILLLLDNIEWIYLYGKGVDGLPGRAVLLLDHLSIWHMVRTVIFSSFFIVPSCFPETGVADIVANHELLYTDYTYYVYCLLLSII